MGLGRDVTDWKSGWRCPINLKADGRGVPNLRILDTDAKQRVRKHERDKFDALSNQFPYEITKLTASIVADICAVAETETSKINEFVNPN